jgi:hypothetical protein
LAEKELLAKEFFSSGEFTSGMRSGFYPQTEVPEGGPGKEGSGRVIK